jgi:hypothetical protein
MPDPAPLHLFTTPPGCPERHGRDRCAAHTRDAPVTLP